MRPRPTCPHYWKRVSKAGDTNWLYHHQARRACRDSDPARKQPKPAVKQGTSDTKAAIARIKAFGRGRKLPDDVTVRDLIAEGRFGLEEPDHTSAATRRRIRRIEARPLQEAAAHPRRPALNNLLAVDASVAMSWCFPDEADGYAFAGA